MKVWTAKYIWIGRKKYEAPVICGDYIPYVRVINDNLILILLPNPNISEPDPLKKHDWQMWSEGDIWSLIELHYACGFLLDNLHEVSIHYGEANAVKAMETWINMQ